MIEEAAALWESLTMNHGLIDGSKRAAYACTELFLQLNGLDITAGNDDAEELIFRHLEDGTFCKQVLESWLRLNTGRFDS